MICECVINNTQLQIQPTTTHSLTKIKIQVKVIQSKTNQKNLYYFHYVCICFLLYKGLYSFFDCIFYIHVWIIWPFFLLFLFCFVCCSYKLCPIHCTSFFVFFLFFAFLFMLIFFCSAFFRFLVCMKFSLSVGCLLIF